MGFDHPALQSTLLPAGASLAAWLVFRLTPGCRALTPLAILVGLASVYAVVFGTPAIAAPSSLDRLGWILSAGVVIGVWPALQPQLTPLTGRRTLLIWLLAGFLWLTIPHEPALLAIAMIGFALLSHLFLITAVRGSELNRLNLAASALASAGLAALVLQSGSASLFQLLVALVVSMVVVMACEAGRTASTHWVTLCAATGAPVLLIGAHLWRFGPVNPVGLALIAAIFVATVPARRTTRRPYLRLSILVAASIALTTAALLISPLLEPPDDAYYDG